jgi:hypothetical protein
MMDLENFVLNPVTLLVIVFGLVEFVKQLGAKGQGLRVISMGFGFALAVIFKLRELYPDWGMWIEVGFFGLAIGLAASGVYGYLNERLPKPSS